MAYKTVNPFTGEDVKSFDEISKETLDQKLQKASSCFENWRKTSFNDRKKIVQKVADLMRERSDELSALITLEMGKRIKESKGEVELSASIYEYYATHAEQFLEEKPLSPEKGSAYVRKEPIGVLLGIEPWNYPYYQVARFAAPNIMAGNCILLKHASNVPQCAMAIEKLFTDAGAPEGLYTNLFVSSEKIDELIANPVIRGVSLTGSEAAGASVAAAAGKNLKKSVLELGGSDPFIVLEDAELDKTVQWAVYGRMQNCGQACTAAKRFIVMDKVYDEFLEKFKGALESMQPGDPMQEETSLGPLSSKSALEGLEEQVEKSVKAGAKLATGGKRFDRQGYFMQPTILTDIPKNAEAYHEELFGPVASVYRVSSEDEAVELANATRFGLGGAIFTTDEKRAQKLAERINSGMIFINHPTGSQPDLPFGGTNQSGYGRELSSLGIDEFLNKKLVRTSDINDQ
ncbi:MAG: NAD-dependent succinate-semialdehyde dehydrogenase [Daejeonella sp.]